jgi:lipoate-protein ligase A
MDNDAARLAGATGIRRLRFWWRGPPAVVMGSSERPAQVVDAEACARLGVELLKRSTGGGSVLQTTDVPYDSLVTPAPTSLDPKAGFRPGADLVCAVLRRFGVLGRSEGTSDVVVGDQKLSGNAQAGRWKAVLVHGTLLVDFDHDLADAVLKHPPREPAYRRELYRDAGRLPPPHRTVSRSARASRRTGARRSAERGAARGPGHGAPLLP